MGDCAYSITITEFFFLSLLLKKWGLCMEKNFSHRMLSVRYLKQSKTTWRMMMLVLANSYTSKCCYCFKTKKWKFWGHNIHIFPAHSPFLPHSHVVRLFISSEGEKGSTRTNQLTAKKTVYVSPLPHSNIWSVLLGLLSFHFIRLMSPYEGWGRGVGWSYLQLHRKASCSTVYLTDMQTKTKIIRTKAINRLFWKEYLFEKKTIGKNSRVFFKNTIQ